MVSSSLNIITFLALMVLPLLHVTQSASITDTSEVLASGHCETSELAVVPRVDTLNRNQELDEISNRRFLGRKMVSKRLLGMVKPEVVYLNVEQSSGSTSTPGSALSVKNSISINAELQRLRNTNRGGPHHTHRRVKVKIAGNFIPLNADYHVPRPHPPKNN